MDYAALAARSAALIAANGAPCQLRRAVAGEYDPGVGEVDDKGTKVFNTKAVRGEFKRSDIDGTEILATDVRLYVAPDLATTPAPGDQIVFDGAQYTVVNSRPLKPATVVLLHDVQCRG